MIFSMVIASFLLAEPPAADHHIHIYSATLASTLQRAQTVMNEPGDGSPPAATGANDVIQVLAASSVRQAAILSTAYLFAMPDLKLENHRALVSAENDYVSREVAKYPDRLKGFCSANPLSDYALDEFKRCLRLPG